MKLGTQIGSDLPYPECASHALFQSSDGEQGPYLDIDPSKPPSMIV